MSIRMKKFEWELTQDGYVRCDLGFCVWEINEFGDIFMNGKHWHKHDTEEGAKIMVENRMREFINGMIEVEDTAETMRKQQIAKDTLLNMAGIIEEEIDEN
jgi:hypothetical protein